MRRRWTLAILATALVCAAGVPLLVPGASADDDAAAQAAAAAKVAKDALTKAVERGNVLFHGKELCRKSCASCHEDPDKRGDDLREVKWSYPAYSRRKNGVVTLQQMINEMLKYRAKGAPLDADSTDLAAIAAYLESIRTH